MPRGIAADTEAVARTASSPIRDEERNLTIESRNLGAVRLRVTVRLRSSARKRLEGYLIEDERAGRDIGVEVGER